MSQLVEVKVPDIGDFADVPVIELFVKPGDTIKAEDAICTLESDKATMDVPSSHSGVVKEVLIKLGDKVSEGIVLLKLEATGDASAGAAAAAPAPAAAPAAGTWTCSCGATNTGKFCPECGSPAPAPAPTKWFCPNCGSENGGKFCSNCGTPRP